MNRNFKIGIAGIIVLITLSVVIIAYQFNMDIRPPPSVITISGKEQSAGIGTFCWSKSGLIGRSICEDSIGVPTVKEPLPAISPFTAYLRMPLNEPPEELQLNIFKVTENDEIYFDSGMWRMWQPRAGYNVTVKPQIGQDVELELEPGLYVLEVFSRWNEKGDVSYGFLVDVQL